MSEIIILIEQKILKHALFYYLEVLELEVVLYAKNYVDRSDCKQ